VLGVRRTTSRLLGLLLALSAGLAAPGPAAATDVTWTRVGTGSTQGISGITAAGSGGWVVVRDNKSSGQNRVSLLGAGGAVTPLSWPGSPPSDLEAIDAVPGRSGQYAVVTSGGAGRVVAVSGTSLTVVRSFTLPTGRNQNEAFALTRFGGTTVAVWGNRGSTTSPGRLFAATFDPSTGGFGAVARGTVTVPYPTTAVRHISDAEVLGGRIVVSSASDPGDSGPFASALYDVGTVRLASGRARLALSTPASLGTFAGHKVEAVACTGGRGILGTDDEKQGGRTAPFSFC
jgi:hypothetical protein